MDSIQQRLKDAGLRATRHRIAVLEALEALGRPVSHPEILREIAHTRIDRVTLYRTLTSLSEVRLVHQVQGTDGGALYGTNSIDEELSLEKLLGLSHEELCRMRAAGAFYSG